MEPIISFKNFGFKYTVQKEPTLYGIDLDIYPGQKVLIAGPSGCGKSTLVSCLNGLAPFSYDGEYTGSLTIKGVEARDSSIFARSKVIGTVLQDSDAQFVGLTVAEDIAFALENDAVAVDEMKKRVQDVADLVDVGGHLAHAPHELSGGQKQRVSLAGVLVDDVDVLLFDEPLANLDPATGESAIELIDRIWKDENKTVIIIEHRLEDVLHRGVDRVILMDDGRILADMTPEQLLCSDLLRKTGIREPLYITALKYAGLAVTPDMHPAHIETLTLSEAQKAQVRDWFDRVESPQKPGRGDALLDVQNVSFAYNNGHQALRDISFSIRKGELTAIAGRNGAGKSTMCKLVCGFEKQQQGTILLKGEDSAEMSIKERGEHVGYVMQNPNQMISKVFIKDEVGLGLSLRGKPQEEIDAAVDDALKICSLSPFVDWPVSALSYGQKKRVTIASILSLHPDVIMLDEPTAGQDFRRYTEIMEFLEDLNRSGVTVLLITHDMHLMLEYCDRALVFSDGKLLADDAPAAVLSDPDLIRAASLKKTSLYDLAGLCGIADPKEFTARFIDCDRKARRGV
ncbi:MAG: ABC transporter ATP-binding protein [Firmicutes bacterium]|nr:ABC transporter ATP-binding protein [Bacillota bacterium]MBR0210541.1 ABC transporter ATP-binding protein [Bacillota bacterium]